MKISNEGVVIGSFIVAFFCFLIIPTFLNSQARMVFPEYIPAVSPIGVDLKQMLSYSQSWADRSTPYIGWNLYPPLAVVLFTPLLLLDFQSAYQFITIATFLAVIFSSLYFVWIFFNKRPLHATTYLLVFTFITSYGVQFEIERGQFNALAMLMAVGAIYIFHYQPRLRYLAYSLFLISVSLKVYPLVFLPLFIDNWRSWRSNIFRLSGLALASFGLLFVLGASTFNDFLGAINRQILNPGVWAGNHSIRSYLSQISTDSNLGISIKNWAWGLENIEVIEKALLLIVLSCVLSVLWGCYQRNRKGFSPELLLVCTLAALLIPPVSHDYKLSILGVPIALCIITWQENKYDLRTKAKTQALLGVFTFLYVSTLFSYTSKPELIMNNMPILLILALLTASMSLLLDRKTQ